MTQPLYPVCHVLALRPGQIVRTPGAWKARAQVTRPLAFHAPGEIVLGPCDHPTTLGPVAASLLVLASNLDVRTPEARAARERLVLALTDAVQAADDLPRP